MSIETFDVGTLIGGKYRLVERLGTGGMGEVWKAEDIRHDQRPVAIKFIAWQTYGDDSEKRERFLQEMRALARLNHPNTVQLIEFGETAHGTLYLVMNYIPGGSLKDRLASGVLDASTRRRVLEELCDALDYIHDQNIVHRDLKPSNILFDAAGHIRISDFGLAKLVDSTYAVSIRAGTPGFEAPEQRAEAFFADFDQGRVPRIDHRADIYALGVIAWLLFTGRHPDAPTPLPTGTLSPELEQVLRKALAHDREDRYDSASEFLEAVISAVPFPGEMGLPTIKRLPLWAWGVAGGVILLLAVGGALLVRYTFRVTPTPAPEQTATEMARVLPTATPVLPTEHPTYTPYPTYTALPADTSTPRSLTSTPHLPTPISPPPTKPKPFPTNTPTVAPTPTLTPTLPPPLDMVHVPAGELLMGSDAAEVDYALQLCNEYYGDCRRHWFSGEQPQHTVYLDAFFIDKTEVTNAQYRECVEAKACNTPIDATYYDDANYAQHPVVHVDWYQASKYCQWAGKRLPTEAEWEKAARGTEGWIYPWGNTFSESKLNFCDVNCPHDWRDASANDGYAETAPVGSYPTGASPYGALDMAGNVWEWVADWYWNDYYIRSPARNPPGPGSGVEQVLRGGSWDLNAPHLVRGSNRGGRPPNYQSSTVGFRCARGYE